MPVSATGFLSLAVDGVRDALSQSSTFQTWTSTASASAAKARVFVSQALTSDTLPHVTVAIAGCERERSQRGVGGLWAGTVTVSALFRETISQSDTTDAFNAFVNKVGAIWAELEAQAADRTRYADITAIRIVQGPSRPEANEALGTSVSAFYEALIEFTVGVHT